MKFLSLALALCSPLALSAQSFRMPEVASPVIPQNSVSISDYGAKNDGSALCTNAFAHAMADLKSMGGGHLVVPAGIWLTGPIQLESHCDLHVEQGALVLFTTDYDAYPDVETVFEGSTSMRKLAPISAVNKTDVSITGPGTFDAQGQAWRPAKRGKFTDSQWKLLIASDGVVLKNVFYPDAYAGHVGAQPGEPDMRRAYHRPVLLEFVSCTRVLLQDATFSNSPAWNLHPLKCSDVTIRHCQVRNPWFAQNGDGLDLESCQRVIIAESTFDVGDDAICIKSGKDKEGRSWHMPCQDVLIEGCVVLHGHGGFVIGSEMSSGARNILVRNCLFNGTDTGLRLKSTRGRGGVVEDIFIQNVNMVNISGDAFTFDLYYANKPVAGKSDADSSSADAVPPASDETPCFRNLFISDVVCQGAARAIYFNGLPEMPIANLSLSNSLFVSVKGAEIHFARDVKFSNVTIQCQDSEPYVSSDVQNFLVE